MTTEEWTPKELRGEIGLGPSSTRYFSSPERVADLGAALFRTFSGQRTIEVKLADGQRFNGTDRAGILAALTNSSEKTRELIWVNVYSEILKVELSDPVNWVSPSDVTVWFETTGTFAGGPAILGPQRGVVGGSVTARVLEHTEPSLPRGAKVVVSEIGAAESSNREWANKVQIKAAWIGGACGLVGGVAGGIFSANLSG